MAPFIRRLALPMLLLVVLQAPPLQAAGAAAEQVRSLIGQTWDQPGEKVLTDPVVIAGDWALAGWTQAGRGGRALLQRQHGEWSVVLCAGAAFSQAAALAEAGVPAATARRLATRLAAAEAKVAPERRRQFDLFGPVGARPQAHDPAHAAPGQPAAGEHGQHDHHKH